MTPARLHSPAFVSPSHGHGSELVAPLGGRTVSNWKRSASGMARMDRSIISGLVETFGVQGAAEKILLKCPKTLAADAEAFFRQHWKDLRSDTVVVWLTLGAPEDEELGLRPTGEIIPRLVAFLVEKAAQDPFSSINLPNWIGNIADEWDRDAIVEGLRGRTSDDLWTRMLPHAAGCTLFKALARLETHGPPFKHPLPAGAVREDGIVPRLAPTLFVQRRDEGASNDLLRKAVMEPTLGSYALWVLREIDQLEAVVAPKLLLDGLPTLKEVPVEEGPKIKFRLEVANALADAPTFKDTVIRRILGASARGVPWGYLWWEIPAVLRDDIGLASIDTDRPAPWALASVERCLTGLDAWEKRLAWLERPEPDPEERVHFQRGAALWVGDPMSVDGAEAFFPRIVVGWLDEPLPERVDEAFEKRLEQALRRIYHYDERIVWNRLAELPLNRERATRIVESTLTSGIFYDLERCNEIAEACGRIEGSVPRPKQWDAKVLRAYARLVGDEGCVSKWFDECLAARDFWPALHLAVCDDRTPRVHRVEPLKEILPCEDFRTLLRLQADHPWLLSEADVIAELASGLHPDSQWSWLAGTVPTYFIPVVEAKAASTPNVELVGDLFAALSKVDVPTRRLAEIAFERVRNIGPNAMPPHQFGKLLDSGKLWENPGADLVAHVLGERGPDGVRWLYQVVFDSCRLTPSVVHVVHAVMAEALINLAQNGLESGDVGSARRALSALASLTAPPRLFRKVRALRELPGSAAVSMLLDANEGLMRRSDNEEPASWTLLDALTTLVSTELEGES